MVWERKNTATGYDVYKYDIPSKTIKAVTTHGSSNRYPVVYGGKIIWQDNRKGNWDIYMNDLPDLTITYLYGPGVAYKGRYVTFTATVKNIGTETAGGFYTRFYLSTNTVISSADKYLEQYYISSLAPGASKTIKITPRMPSSLATGYYYLGAITDATNKVIESPETNNIKYRTTRIYVRW